MYRILQAARQPRFLSDLADALSIGELMQRDNPCDPVFFEEEMHGRYVPCGCFRALAPKPAGIWVGAVFGDYYRADENGVTRQISWEEQRDERRRCQDKQEAIDNLRREYRLGNITRDELEAGREALSGRARETQPATPILRHAMAETERSKIKEALVSAGWNISRAAENLGLPRTTLLSRMYRLNIVTPRRQQTAAA
jgi:hypothetical protein